MEFDPYWKWLGIDPEQQPADHYQLLGIRRFEEDDDVIENAAVRQMAHVRTFQGGQHAELSQQLLNELSAARICLLNLDQKQAYDEELESQLPSESRSRMCPWPRRSPLPLRCPWPSRFRQQRLRYQHQPARLPSHRDNEHDPAAGDSSEVLAVRNWPGCWSWLPSSLC